MPILFRCPACGQQYRLKDEMAGKVAKCKCGQAINVPAADPPSSLEGLLDSGLSAPAQQPHVPAAGGGFMPPGAGFQPPFQAQARGGDSNRVLWLALGAVGTVLVLGLLVFVVVRSLGGSGTSAPTAGATPGASSAPVASSGRQTESKADAQTSVAAAQAAPWPKLMQMKGPTIRALSRDGTLLVVSMAVNASTDEVVVWDLSKDEEVSRFTTRTTPNNVDLSPDGRLLATSLEAVPPDSTRYVGWDVKSRQEVFRATLESKYGFGPLRFSNDGKWALCRLYRSIAQIDAVSGELHHVPIFDVVATTAAFSPTADVAAVGAVDPKRKIAEVQILDLKSKNKTTSFQTADIPERIAFSADGKRLIVAATLGQVVVRETQNWTETAKLPGTGVRSYLWMAVSPDGNLVVLDGFRTDNKDSFVVWNLATNQAQPLSRKLSNCTFLSDGTLIGLDWPTQRLMCIDPLTGNDATPTRPKRAGQ
jgi:DNA-binding beta-propeller fold protein YncE